MAALLLVKRVTINISKVSSKVQPARYVDSANRLFSDCFSTACERVQGSNVAAETRREGNGPDRTPAGSPYNSAANDPTGQGLYEAKQQALDPDEHAEEGATQFVADTAKEGIRKATQVADIIGDAAKKTMDGAWEAAKEANQKIRETVVGGNDRNNSHNHNDDDDSNNNNVEDPVVVEAHNIDGPVDTVEYRNIEGNIDDLKRIGDRAD